MVPGHKGGHAWGYHEAVYGRLRAASKTGGNWGFYRELIRLRKEVNDLSSPLFPLVRIPGR